VDLIGVFKIGFFLLIFLQKKLWIDPEIGLDTEICQIMIVKIPIPI